MHVYNYESDQPQLNLYMGSYVYSDNYIYVQTKVTVHVLFYE